MSRRKRTLVETRRGRHTHSLPLSAFPGTSPIAVAATLTAAAIRCAADGSELMNGLQPEDLRVKICRGTPDSLVIFLVDASDSMSSGAVARMTAAKGAVMALLTTAYQKRDKVALIAFRDKNAEILLSPTASISLARDRLRELPTGGTTPLADALIKARQMVSTARSRDPRIRPVLVLISDGEATVPHQQDRDPVEECLELAAAMRSDGMRVLAFDTKPDAWFLREKTEMRRLAEAIGGTYRCLSYTGAARIIDAVLDQ